MKKIAKLFVMVCVFAVALVGVAFAAQSGDWTYTTNTSGATITGYSGSANTLTLPKTLGGKSVVAIDVSAFRGNSTLSSVTIPSSIKTIGNYAFCDCSNLKTVKLESGVTKIGVGAFMDCARITSVTLSDTLTTLSENAFSGCKSLLSITIPGKVATVGVGSFIGCAALRSVTFEEGIKKIAEDAFADCVSLTSVTIPNSVTSVSGFARCTKLKTVNLGKAVTEIADDAFQGCTALADVNFAEGSKVKTIGKNAFSKNSSLASFNIPSTVTTIGQSAFYDCVLLDNITIPASLSFIDKEVFSGCTNLKKVTINPGITSIGWRAFYKSGLTSITIPYTVEVLGEACFSYCEALTALRFDINCEFVEINGEAFKECSSLSRIDFSQGEYQIGREAFSGTSSLKDVTLSYHTTELGINCFEYSGLTSITVPPYVEEIGNAAFIGCKNLETVVLCEGVSYIGNAAFKNCYSLLTIEIPESFDDWYDGFEFMNDGKFTIRGYKNSTAQSYASKIRNATATFEPIDGPVLFIKDRKLKMATKEVYGMEYGVFPSADYDMSEIKWSSSDPNVVSVDANGIITANRYGKATITARYTDKARGMVLAQSCEVTSLFYDVCGHNLKGFSDYQYYYDPVYWAADAGITTGYDKVYFGVGENCTRASLMIFLWRYLGCPAPKNNAQKYFTDMGKYGATSATNQAVAWAYENNITKGYTENGKSVFKPTASITRKDTLIMLYRAAGKPSVSGTMKFTDCTKYKVGSDTYNAILWGSSNGITSGYSGGVFKPDANCLREQIVTFLYRYSNLAK